MNPTFLRTCVAATLLAGAAAAQSPTFGGWRSDLHLWEELSGTAQTLEPGRLNGDTRMDALLRTDETLAVVIGPALFESYSLFGEGSTGATVVAGATQDSVAAADNSGLSLWSWSSGAGAMVETVLSTSGSWQNAVALQSLPLGSNQAIVGLTADRKSIVRGVWSGSSWTESTINVGAVIRSWCVLDFTSDAGHEYAIVTANGFTVLDNAGDEIADALAQFGGGEQLYRVPGAGAGADTVAYIFPYAGYWYLSVVSLKTDPEPEYITEPAQFIGGPVADAQIADWDLDGKADLVITSANTPETWILHRDRVANSPWRFQADPASVYHVPHSSSLFESGEPDRMLTKTALADFDFDGDVDLLGVALVEGTAGLSLFRNTPRNEDDRRPRLSVASGCEDTPDLCAMTSIVDLDTNEVIGMQFDLDIDNPDPLASGAAATHLEFLCYLQDEFQPFYPSATLFVDTTPTLDTHLSIPGGNPTDAYTVTVNVQGRYDPALAYNFAISAIRKVNGVIVERGPATVSVLSETAFVPPLTGPQPFAPEFVRFSGGGGLPNEGNERPTIRPSGGPSGGGG